MNNDQGDKNKEPFNPMRPRAPAFNVPTIILLVCAALCMVHAYRIFLLDGQGDEQLLLQFAFWPARFDATFMARYGDVFDGGNAGAAASFITYGFLHGDWLHLTVNCFWLIIFGSPLVRRFGGLRFVLISLVGSAAGAGLQLASNWGSVIPMVGASAAISAHMACAARFAFVAYGPLGRPRSDHPGAYFLPALTLVGMFKNTQAISFLAIWFAVNLLFGLGGGIIAGEAAIAWQAHIGGFLAGLVLFPVLDPVSRTVT